MDNVLFQIRRTGGDMVVEINPVLPEVMHRDKLAALLDEAAAKLGEKAEKRRRGEGLSEGELDEGVGGAGETY